MSKHEQIRHKLLDLNTIICHVFQRLNLEVEYRVFISETTTYVKGKYEIYLVVWDIVHDTLFDDNTLVHALLHEVCHIIDTSDCHGCHTPAFNELEDRVLQSAEDLGYYNPGRGPSNNYPCLQHDI